MQTSKPRLVHTWFRLFAASWLLAACSSAEHPVSVPQETPKAIILTMNDIYRINGIKRGTEGGLARLATIRDQLAKEGELLVLHGGDLLSPSLLGNTYKGAQMVDLMNMLDGKPEKMDDRLFVVFGNHEFDYGNCDKRPERLIDQINKSDFTWLAGNLDFSKCSGLKPLADAKNILPHTSVTIAGIKFGLFGITLNMSELSPLITDRKPVLNSDTIASNVTSYIAAAKRLTAKLRSENDFVIGLTHLDWSDDVAILNALQGPEGPDLIIGGHNHTKGRIAADNSETRAVYKQTAEARDVGVFEVSKNSDGSVSYLQRSVVLDQSVEPNLATQQRIDEWFSAHEKQFCASDPALSAQCLSDKMGTTKIAWTLEEDDNRSKETQIGNWFADKMLETATPFTEGKCQPQQGVAPPAVAFLGSGSLRLNYDLPAHYALERRDIEELFPYPMEMVKMCITGKILKDQLAHGLSLAKDGGWPHLAGMKIHYTGEVQFGTKPAISKITDMSGSEIKDAMQVMLVANSYVASQGNGYKWGICNDEVSRSICQSRIPGDANFQADNQNNIDADVAAYLFKNGKPADLKAMTLNEFQGAGLVGPSDFKPRHNPED